MPSIEMLKKMAKRRAMKGEAVKPEGEAESPEGMPTTPPAPMGGMAEAVGGEETPEPETAPQTGGIMGSADAIKSVADSGDFAVGGASGTLSLPASEHSKLTNEAEGMNVVAIISGKATLDGNNVNISVDEASVVHGNPMDYNSSRMGKMKALAKSRAGQMAGGNMDARVAQARMAEVKKSENLGRL